MTNLEIRWIPTKSIFEVICDGQDVVKLGNREINGRQYVARFNFTGKDQQEKSRGLVGRRAQSSAPS